MNGRALCWVGAAHVDAAIDVGVGPQPAKRVEEELLVAAPVAGLRARHGKHAR